MGFRHTLAYFHGFVSVSLKEMPLMEVAVCLLRFIFQVDITHTIYWPAFLSLAGFLRGPSLRLPLRFSLSTLKSAFLLSSLFLPASSVASSFYLSHLFSSFTPFMSFLPAFILFYAPPSTPLPVSTVRRFWLQRIIC